MATPDGITSADWDRVHELALWVLASLSDPEAEKESHRELLQYLDTLEAKYGPRPSILATRADFVDSDESTEQLLHRAYHLAVATSDHTNKMYIAHSLAQFYIEQQVDIVRGRKWLERLDAHLLEVPDDYFSKDARTMAERLTELDLVG